MVELSRELEGQREDEEMESLVVGEINRKKEPARSIARRQKRMKEEREAREQAQQSGGMEVEEAKQPDSTPEGERDESMVVEDEAGGTDAPADGDGGTDPRDELDAAVSSWRELAGRQKLCLELIANLCSTRDGIDEGEEDDGGVMGYGDDDERMWDSDDEARLLASAGACAGGDGAQRGRTTPSEDATFASLAGRDVPGKTLGLFLRWAAFLPSLGGDVPDLVADDVAEILEVASTCMSNMTSCDLPTWTEPATGPDGGRHSSGLAMFWSGLVPVLSAGETGRGTEAARAGAASALLSMLTSREESRCLVDEKGLETILGLLDEGGGTGADGGDDVYRIRTQCSAISILGVLCSGPHPAEVDARVCRSLLARLRSASADDSSTDPAGSCAVTHEVLNVLMDVYGGDDCHDSVMAAEDVVGHFQRCLPGFRRRVRKCSGAGSAGRGEVEVWNETALNASRFIKYCKEK
ncbi:hypothetical protein THAOC_31790 [Thalassiosira oceanica]|uniref:SYO1-like TPR repeats domain-containing protein n=1 Tax=Thalassiosira oceanica TaxID=159749 RepID=K0RKB0_THAOC|nr:hypothetical protein THAOC_31790 [Thalassiosira oceanica]|eukprot:EJK49341.1 hypothetical protein THAOC_31790 [Thalassiosira oceanica]